MSGTQHKQLYELQKKSGLIKSKKTPESSRALEARVATFVEKTDNSSNERLFANEKLTASDKIIQPLTKREVAPDRAMQKLDG